MGKRAEIKRNEQTYVRILITIGKPSNNLKTYYNDFIL